MGRDRKIRAVELKLPNRNTVIRPINLLYPLKLQDTNETKMPEEDENKCPKSEGSTKDEQDMKTSEKITLDDGPISSRTRSHVTVPGLECRQIGRRVLNDVNYENDEEIQRVEKYNGKHKILAINNDVQANDSYDIQRQFKDQEVKGKKTTVSSTSSTDSTTEAKRRNVIRI
ncbi:hypothetical protein QQG55_42080 [Brugia pahangi]